MSKIDDILRVIPKDGTVFRIKFTKQDGTERVMVCQLGVVHGLVDHAQGISDVEAGIDSPEARKWLAVQKRKENNPHLLNVWDVEKQAWRTVNLLTVTEVTLPY